MPCIYNTQPIAVLAVVLKEKCFCEKNKNSQKENSFITIFIIKKDYLFLFYTLLYNSKTKAFMRKQMASLSKSKCLEK